MDRILNVAIATETILYAPFYTAWLGGDFEQTPFDNVNINLIARENDSYFRKDVFKNLKAADGFVSLCLVFGYADVGICDPSFIIQACESDNGVLLKSVFNEFFSALSSKEQLSFKDNHQSLFDGDSILTEELKLEIKKNGQLVKIVGGLISRIAFSVIGNQEIEQEVKKEAPPYLGAIHFCQDVTSPNNQNGAHPILGAFAKRHIANILFFPQPSTAYCIAEGFRNAFDPNKLPIPIESEFGKEIDKLLSLDSTLSKTTVGLTCDFVSLDFILDKGIDVIERDASGNPVLENKDINGESKQVPKIAKQAQKLYEIEDWVKSTANTAMFTGVLANSPTGEKKELIAAFLYAIDKNLFQIELNIKKGRTDLSNFFKSKLNTSHPKSGEEMIQKLLIAYPEIEKQCSIDDLIYYWVNRLIKWKKEHSPLYYTSIKPSIKDLKKIYEIRLKAYPIASVGATPPKGSLNTIEFNLYIEDGLLKEWEEDEQKIKSYKDGNRWKRFWWNLFTNDNKLLYFGAFFIGLEIISILIKLTNFHFVELSAKGYWDLTYRCRTYLHIPAVIVATFIFLLVTAAIIGIVVWGKKLHSLKEKDKYIFRK